MPVEQPVLDTNYKHLKVTRTWQKKTTIIKTIITIAIIVAYRGENKMPTKKQNKNQKQTKKTKQKATKNRVVGGGGGEIS